MPSESGGPNKKKTLFFCLLFTKLSAEARMSDSSELSDKVTGDIH